MSHVSTKNTRRWTPSHNQSHMRKHPPWSTLQRVNTLPGILRGRFTWLSNLFTPGWGWLWRLLTWEVAAKVILGDRMVMHAAGVRWHRFWVFFYFRVPCISLLLSCGSRSMSDSFSVLSWKRSSNCRKLRLFSNTFGMSLHIRNYTLFSLLMMYQMLSCSKRSQDICSKQSH